MLIEFTVGNFRSFKEPAAFSMVAAKIQARDPHINQNNTILVNERWKLLTSAAVYGANASGKSNFIKAMSFMKNFVLFSTSQIFSAEGINTAPFLLNTSTESQPSLFQVIFLIEGVTYRYGFEVNKHRVEAEWLFAALSQKESRLFVRTGDDIQISRSFKEGRDLQTRTRPASLFLSVVEQWNGEIAHKIITWFRSVEIISGLNDREYQEFTLRKFSDEASRKTIIDFVTKLDLGIEDMKSQVPSAPGLEEAAGDEFSIQTAHLKFNDLRQLVATEMFTLASQESLGTQKIFFLAGPILDVLAKGSILLIDEMEARLHPIITRSLIGLFNSKETNPQNAQLVFTTHDTNLLSNRIFRRDQVWFVEKDTFGASHLYSLVEIKVRNDASFEKDYFEGRYGAIPYVSDQIQVTAEN